MNTVDIFTENADSGTETKEGVAWRNAARRSKAPGSWELPYTAPLALRGLGSPELMAALVYSPNFRRQCLS